MAKNLMETLAGKPSLFAENTQFSQELIQSFTTEVTQETDENGKLIITYRSGFTGKFLSNKQDRFKGFVWSRIFGPSIYRQYKYCIRSEWGMVDNQSKVYTEEDINDEPSDLPLAGKYYMHGYGGYTVFPKEMLLQILDLGHVGDKLLYCGMHKNGTPHGLGVKFFHGGDEIAELPGLWQDDKLTHLKVNDKLVPVLKPENQADAKNVCTILDRIAEVCAKGDDQEKAFAMELKKHCNSLMQPYLEDADVLFATSERYLKMGEEKREEAFALREKAIERAKTMEQKLAWAWILYDDYCHARHPRKNAILEQYAEWCLANPDIDVAPIRRYIAYKTVAHQLRETNPAKAREFETAAKALWDMFMANFVMETDEKGEEFKAGFKYHGRFIGMVWQKTYKSHGGNSCGSYIGIADEVGLLWCDLDKNTLTVDILDWVPEIHSNDASAVYYGNGAGPLLLVHSTNVPSMLLVEEDDKNRCTFCGMHYDGIRHGLGSQFFHSVDGKHFSELQGLWQDGKLTHVRSGGRFIPLDVEPSREDGKVMSVIYYHIAESADPENAKAYYEKSIELREKLIDGNTGEGELLQLAQCYKGAGKGDQYVALLNEIMDRFGNDANLAWELYTYLDEKNDPRITQALERYLACEGGDPEKRMKAAAILKRDDVTKEAYLKTFGNLNWRNHYTMSHGDVDCYAELDVWGFIADGKVSGYAWSREENEGALEDSYTYRCCGFLKEEYVYDSTLNCHVPEFACWVPFRIGWAKTDLRGEVPPEVLAERDDQGRITFCGMQMNGLRHGLGTEFYWKDGKIDSVFQGYWEEGKLTFKVDGENLVPSSGDELTH